MRDGSEGKWLEFSSPCEVITTCHMEEVVPLVRLIEERVGDANFYAAGFISYEAAPAFDSSLPAKADGDFPLIWFCLFKEAVHIELPEDIEAPVGTIKWKSSVIPEEHRRRLLEVKEAIGLGDTYQVNLTHRLRTSDVIDTWKLFLQMAGEGQYPFAAFIDSGDWAISSASPELFLRVDGDLIESRPMKGTAPRGLWYEDDLKKREDLIFSEKDRAENVMIVDMVRNDLGRVALHGSVETTVLFEAERYPTLWQMTSTVKARTSESLASILSATFPPASITGAPKRRTMEIISRLEESPRKIYTGTIGFWAPRRKAQFNVAIRTVLVDKRSGSAEYGVGGGIVWDSEPEKEYEECLVKTKVLSHPSGAFDLLETLIWSLEEGYPLLKYHLKRLAASAEYFGFRLDMARVREELARLAVALVSGMHRVRLFVSRHGAIGSESVPILSDPGGFGRVGMSKSPVDKRDIFLYHKTTRRDLYANALKMCPGSDDVLLFNEEGQITESSIANVAIEVGGILYTPPLQCGLLPGTQRARLLDMGHLRERVVAVDEVLSSPQIYLLNAVRGIRKVCLSLSSQEPPNLF